jgi:hypothetical protein
MNDESGKGVQIEMPTVLVGGRLHNEIRDFELLSYEGTKQLSNQITITCVCVAALPTMWRRQQQ